MKKIIYLLMLMPLISYAQTQKIALNTDSRGRDCNGGLGLCSAVISTTNKTAATTLAYKKDESTIVIEYNKIQLSITDLNRLLGKNLDKTTFVQDFD